MQVIKQWVKRKFPRMVYRNQLAASAREKWESKLAGLKTNAPVPLSKASYDIFTYHGEDGILLYLVDHLKIDKKYFVDIGSGDGIKSNCASLAVHYNWKGIFIDQDEAQLSVGKSFYKSIHQSGSVEFIGAKVTPTIINELLISRKIFEIGVLSIDIDGNDYWIWKAIDCCDPEIVIIESKVEFGKGNFVVPYSDKNHISADPKFNGASVEAFKQLGRSKGYKLAGSNKQGYNLFFVKDHCALPEATTDMILSDEQTVSSFYGEDFFSSHQFESV